MKAIVKGRNCMGFPFKLELEFTLIPPSDPDHYGTGCYMLVDGHNIHDYVDVRYEKTTALCPLASRWINNYFGKNAEQVRYIDRG